MLRARSLIVSFFALAALAAFTSPSALAEEFEAGELPVAVAGFAEGTATVLKVGGGEIKCTGLTYSGELTDVSKTLSLSPLFSGCKGFGGLAATVTTSGCRVVLDLAGTLGIACEAGSSIKIKDAFNICQVTVPAQSGLSSVVYENSEAKTELTVTYAANVTGLSATVVGGACPVTAGTYNNGTLTGIGRLGAKDEAGADVAFWMKKPTVLCPGPPEAKVIPLTCPGGEEFEGEITGTLKKNAVFESKAGAVGSVTCKAATFTGENFTPDGKGSVKIVYNGGKGCETNIAGLKAPKVVLEEGKPYEASRFSYVGHKAPFQGAMRLKTVPAAVSRLDFEGEGLTCSYKLEWSRADVVNPVEPAPMELKLSGKWFELNGNVQCPTKLRSETVFTLEQAGGGALYVTSQ